MRAFTFSTQFCVLRYWSLCTISQSPSWTWPLGSTSWIWEKKENQIRTFIPLLHLPPFLWAVSACVSLSNQSSSRGGLSRALFFHVLVTASSPHPFLSRSDDATLLLTPGISLYPDHTFLQSSLINSYQIIQFESANYFLTIVTPSNFLNYKLIKI